MKIFIICGLSEDKLVTKLTPFQENKDIERVYLIRDKMCSLPLDKVTCVFSPKHKSWIRQLEKIYAGWKFLRKHKIDIVISFNMCPHGYIGFILSRLMCLPWVHIIVAGHKEIWQNGKWVKRLNVFLLKKSSQIVVMGDKTKKYLIDSKIKSNNICIIPNVIDDNRFKPNTNSIKTYDIVSLGRIDYNKNVVLLINAVKKLIGDFPNLKVAIGGDGNQMIVLKKLTEKYGLQQNISFVGEIPPSESPNFYHSANIFVLASYSEGVPMALLEAMFCGLACVSTNVGEIESFLRHEENGFLLSDPDNVDELVKFLKMLLLDTSLRHRIASEAVLLRESMNFKHVTDLWSDCLLKTIKSN